MRKLPNCPKTPLFQVSIRAETSITGRFVLAHALPIFVVGNVHFGELSGSLVPQDLALIVSVNYYEGVYEMADAMNTAKNRLQDVKDQVGQAAAGAAETVRNAASDFGNRAQGFVSDASRRAADAGAYVSQQVEDATSNVGDRLKDAGNTVRQRIPQEGGIGQAGEAVASSLENTGEYLKRQGFRGIESDLIALVKNNPIPSILIGIGLGFVLARALTTRD